jgi:hypothetical protein
MYIRLLPYDARGEGMRMHVLHPKDKEIVCVSFASSSRLELDSEINTNI